MVMLVQCGGERGVGCVRAMVVVVAEKVWRGCDGEGGRGGGKRGQCEWMAQCGFNARDQRSGRHDATLQARLLPPADSSLSLSTSLSYPPI